MDSNGREFTLPMQLGRLVGLRSDYALLLRHTLQRRTYYLLKPILRGDLMNIGKLCQRSVVTARRSDELTTAAQLMREKHIGY